MRHRLPGATLLSTLILWAGCVAAKPPVHPQTSQTPRKVPAQEPLRQIYREVDGRSLPAYVFSPAVSHPAPAILLFHGGGWVSGEAAWTFEAARRFQQLGLVAIPIEYRLAEGKVTPIEQLADTCAAFHWVRRNAASLGVDAAKVAGYGVSAGGHLVAAAATLGCGNREGQLANGGPDVMLLLSPAVDAADDGWFTKLLQGRADARDYSPVDHIPARLAPTILVQGTEDNVTPLAGARRFCAAVASQGGRCDLHVYPGVGHLLTRNLKEQERDFDPDPAMRADAIDMQEQFLRELWLRPGGLTARRSSQFILCYTDPVFHGSRSDRLTGRSLRSVYVESDHHHRRRDPPPGSGAGCGAGHLGQQHPA
jgi:acetyl esterase